MTKTIVQKVASPDPGVTVFKISGTLGFHENKVLEKFFQECASRKIDRLVLDLSELDSLGGGCAKIIREAAGTGNTRVCVAGASRTVQGFLSGKEKAAVLFAGDLDGAVRAVRHEESAVAESSAKKSEPGGRDVSPAVTRPQAPPMTAHAARREPGEGSRVQAAQATAVAEPPRSSGATQPLAEATEDSELKEARRLLGRYRTLFSLNKEFSLIEEKARLLDAFLLSVMAQVGVESAVFLELSNDSFQAVCWRGFETADPQALAVRRDEVEVDRWLRSPKILPIGEAPLAAEARSRLGKWDLPLVSPFIVRRAFRGMVLLGKPVRRALDADSWEFMSMMFDQVAIAYENSCRLEEQSGRTLGLVQSLISMIESNTLSRGTTEMVMNFTYSTAVKMHYPEEHLRDLLYGTVLRDIGMLSMNNYIVRSPRELVPEEWEIIKQHTIEGAATLQKMGFSDHSCGIVRSHHERYNGEGYPDRLAGPQIPLGARILSVVESYTAMLHDRPNRPALTADEAISTLVENWGVRYDPEVVNAFLVVLEEEARAGRKAVRRGIDLFKEKK